MQGQSLVWSRTNSSFKFFNTSFCLTFDPNFRNPLIWQPSNGSLEYKHCNNSDPYQRISFHLSDLSLRPFSQPKLCLTAAGFGSSAGIYWSECPNSASAFTSVDQEWLLQSPMREAFCNSGESFADTSALRICRAESLNGVTSM